ncbi:hypothetical protein DFJ74DRAFT_312514 [Hyaloraphidium curvatum]|nr:hypothetical protein DFJ74DRAFT_312514 [Hyaloraphidium curvatum]
MDAQLWLSPALQLALFPAPVLGPPPDVPAWLWPADAVAAAAAGRAARPLTASALCEELDNVKPMGTLIVWEGAARRIHRSPWARVTGDIALFALFALTWVFGVDVFGISNLVAALVALVLLQAAWFLAIFGFGLYGRRLRPTKDTGAAGKPADRRNPLVDSNWLALAARYLQLCTDERRAAADLEAHGNADAESFLFHDDSDDLCPCSRSDCLGHALLRARTFMVVYTVIHGLLTHVAFGVAAFYGPAVTFARSVWSTPWSTVMCALCICIWVPFIFTASFFPSSGYAGILVIELRLRHRAVALSLQGLHQRLSRALDCGPSDDASLAVLEAEPYVGLHGRMLADWRNFNKAGLITRRIVATVCFFQVLGAVINIGVGSCFPAFYLGNLVVTMWVLGVQAVGNAYKNLQPERVAAQYRSAAQSLSYLAAKVPPDRPRLLAAVKAHRDLLLSFVDLSAFKSGFFGVPVTFGTVRGVVVAGFTVAAGLWTILRATGVYVTLDLACRLSST